MRQFHKMVKHPKTIRWQIADELFECVWPFCGIGALRVKPSSAFTKTPFVSSFDYPQTSFEKCLHNPWFISRKI